MNKRFITNVLVLICVSFIVSQSYATIDEIPLALIASEEYQDVPMGSTVYFDGTGSPIAPLTGSYDPDNGSPEGGGNGIDEYWWKYFATDIWNNDGGTPSHYYDTADIYAVSLKVVDDELSESEYDDYCWVYAYKVDEVQEQVTENPGPLSVALNEEVDLRVKPYPDYPGVEDYYPANETIWEISLEPPTSNASLVPDSPPMTATLSDLTVPGEYKVKAKCGSIDPGDEITIYVVEVDLDIDGVIDDDEEDVGQVVVLNFDDNTPPRKKVILRKATPNNWPGNVLLTRNGSKVGLFESATGGTPINFDGVGNKFSNSVLPKSLWVEGNIASMSMCDVELDLEAEGVNDCYDRVTFTVLWVNLDTDHTDSINEDNSAIDVYKQSTVPPSDSTLGHHLFYHCYPTCYAWLGRGSEIMGHLTVLDFDPSKFSSEPDAIHLTREIVDGNTFRKAWGNEEPIQVEQAPAGDDDTGEPHYRDDIPLSGGSPSVIYDMDRPGPFVPWNKGMLYSVRLRANLRQWAVWKDPDTSALVRCSEKLDWFTRQAYIKSSVLGSYDMGNVDSWHDTWIQDDDKEWAIDRWVPGILQFDMLNGSINVVRRINSNTDVRVNVERKWGLGESPMTGTGYEVIGTSTWLLDNEVSGDNISADGTTNITWDLEDPE